METTKANQSWSNIDTNLKGLYNNVFAPLLGTPKIQLFQDARKLQAAKTENMKNKVYAEGERIPQELHLLGGRWYGDGSGRTWKQGGRVPCRDRFDGRIEGSHCNKFRKKYGQVWGRDGWQPQFVDDPNPE